MQEAIQALTRLDDEGLVEMEPNRVFRVKTPVAACGPPRLLA
jgi:Mn-dependent DtxR family transcriptional regulator